MRSVLAGLRRLVIPWGASGSQDRVVLSTDDPVAVAAGQSAAILWYWGNQQAFLLSIGKSGVDGVLKLSSYDATNGLAQLVKATHILTPYETRLQLGVDTMAVLNLFGMTINIAPPSGANKSLNLCSNEADGATDPDLTFYGISAGRGLRSRISDTASSAAIGTTETVVLTVLSRPYRANRCYRVKVGGQASISVTTNTMGWQLRKTNATGQIVGVWSRTPSPSTTGIESMNLEANFTVGAADVTAVMVLTLQASAGTATHAGSANRPRKVEIYDCGAASSFPNEPVLV